MLVYSELPGKICNVRINDSDVECQFMHRELFVSSREGSMPEFMSGVHVSLRTPVLSISIPVSSSIDVNKYKILIYIGSTDIHNDLNW